MNGEKANGSWHLDKKVPVILVLMIAIQTGGFIWWASNIETRVTHNEAALKSRAPKFESVTRLETTMKMVEESLRRIEDKMDRITGPQNR